jgi:hypothetical protein
MQEFDMDYEAIYSNLSTVSRAKAWLNTQVRPIDISW